MLSIKQGGIKYYFWVFGMTRPGIEPQSLGPLVNTQMKKVHLKDAMESWKYILW